ncbi:ABC transporter permease [Nocardioides marmoriginsengisoli]|uniref:ABC transporter permease n=1 Tax=Nocardioides marmoriginsengisoli TaxID=661483 RepID=A0A3N0CIF5_9ACTN|nr:ABC transporter permease [Nocardioides marmoriginsengisoli]RNL62786.1 ABC transporter permease [Nocardioides marmoriginsengisoli]
MALAIKPALSRVGGFVSLVGDSSRAMFRRPFPLQEYLEQTVFIASVSILPAVFVTIPFTVVVQFFINQLLQEIGATDLAGGGSGFVVIQELGPFCSVLVVAGAGATAVCADLGSRRIREELDAMETLGLDPMHRLVAPRVLAFTTVALGLFGIVSVVGLVGTYVFSVVIGGASPGLFVSNLTLVTGAPEFIMAMIKTLLFGVTAAWVACYLGMNAKGGPKGVGEAVNQTVVVTLMVLVVINSAVTTVYLQLGV